MNADERFQRAIHEASGYLDLAILNKDGDGHEEMKQAAIAALKRVADDDDLIDAMYDEDMRNFCEEQP